jgi:hypothetical protein
MKESETTRSRRDGTENGRSEESCMEEEEEAIYLEGKIGEEEKKRKLFFSIAAERKMDSAKIENFSLALNFSEFLI